MHFALCKEQQHSQKQELKLLQVFKPAGLTACIFLSLSVHFACSSGDNAAQTFDCLIV
jgi:hypothetical protein